VKVENSPTKDGVGWILRDKKGRIMPKKQENIEDSPVENGGTGVLRDEKGKK